MFAINVNTLKRPLCSCANRMKEDCLILDLSDGIDNKDEGNCVGEKLEE